MKFLEDFVIGVRVVDINVIDKDFGLDGIFIYFIISGNEDNNFGINFSIGIIIVKNELDYEIVVRYFFVIWVSDNVLFV